MARKTTPLTATQIQQAKSKDKEYNLLDGEGLALRVMPTGSKLWLFNYYRPISRKRANFSLGKYPAVTLAKARTKAIELRVLLADGIDPKQHRDSILNIKQKELNNTLQLCLIIGIALKRQVLKN